MGDIPEPIEGLVPGGRYHINRTSFERKAIEHGWIILQIIDDKNEFKVEASFLYFANREDARNVHKNLLRLKGERFLRSHFIIARKEGIWVAVEKIEYSLEDYKNKHRLSLDNPEARLPPNYQLIIRDIIMGMCQIHQQELIHGNFSSKHIMIIKDRAKFGFITNRNYDSGDSDFTRLREIFYDVLGGKPNPEHVDRNSNLEHVGQNPNPEHTDRNSNPENVDRNLNRKHFELIHFHESATTNHWKNLQKLYFHPLLMSSGERFLLPVRADARLHYRNYGNARLHFRNFGIGSPISDFKGLFDPQFNWISVVSERDNGYLIALDGKPDGKKYRDDAWDLFKFVRNTIVHINENIRKENKRRREQVLKEGREIEAKIKKLENRRNRKNEVQNLRASLKAATYLEEKKEAEVERDLSSMFPYFLIKVYDLLSRDEITPPVWKRCGDFAYI